MATTKSPLQRVEWPVEPFFSAAFPLSPSVNGSFETNHSAQFYGSPALKQFKKDAKTVLSAQRAKQNWSVINAMKESKDKIPLAMDITFFFPTLYRRDCSGPVKAAEDAVFDFIGINDNRVVRIVNEKYADRDNPRVEVSVRVCTERIVK